MLKKIQKIKPRKRPKTKKSTTSSWTNTPNPTDTRVKKKIQIYPRPSFAKNCFSMITHESPNNFLINFSLMEANCIILSAFSKVFLSKITHSKWRDVTGLQRYLSLNQGGWGPHSDCFAKREPWLEPTFIAALVSLWGTSVWETMQREMVQSFVPWH